METRKITCYAALMLGACLLITSCVKDDLYNTPHPMQGAVKITTDWSARSTESVLPTDYTLRISEQEEQPVSEATNVFHSLLTPGEYDLLVHNSPAGMTVSGTTATVNSLSDGTLEPLPGYLFSAAQTLNVLKDDTLRTTVKMQQRTRQLTLVLKLKDGDHDRILSTEATLTGITPSVNLLTGALPATGGASITPVFEKATSSEGLPILQATFRLLGITTNDNQQLTVVVTLNNNQPQTITTDLTSILHQLPADSMEPVTLDATFTLPPEANISGSITDWSVEENGDISAN